MQITSNDFEYSSTFAQFPGVIDVVVVRQGCPELVIGVDNESGDHKAITLSPDEARQLREHLNDPQTMAILGICDIASARCPGCSKMVSSFEGHDCIQ